jgi:hypothetical protein
MRIRWTVPAANDLAGIKDYLQEHFSHFAEPTDDLQAYPFPQNRTEPRETRPP